MKAKALCFSLFFFAQIVPLLAASPMRKAISTWENIGRLSGLIAIVIFLICLKFGWLAVVSLYSLLRPQKVIKGSQLLVKRGIVCFVVGICVLAAASLLFAVAKQLLGKSDIIISGPVFLFLLYLLISGAAIIYQFFGERIQNNIGSTTIGSSLYAVIYGGILVLSVDFVPVVGWLVSFLILVEAAGIGTLMLIKRKT